MGSFKSKILQLILPQRQPIHRFVALGCCYFSAILARRREIYTFFDAEYYASSYLGGRATYWEAVLHFVRYGWKDSLDPNPFVHLRFVKNLYPDQFSSFDRLAILLGGKFYMNSLLKRDCTCYEFANAVHSNNYDELSDLLAFDPQYYHSKQTDLIGIGDPTPILHLFLHGLKESRLSRCSILRAFNVPFDISLNDYDNLRALRAPLAQFSYHDTELSFDNQYLVDRAVHISTRSPVFTISIGVVLYKNTSLEVRKLIDSIIQNNDQTLYNLSLMFYDNCPGETSIPLDVALPFEIFNDPTNPGFGNGHNFLMSKAFSAGSDIYIGLNPDGFLLPSVLPSILAFIETKPPGCLVELNTFPLPHPKWFDPHTGDTDWASGVAFAIDSLGFSRTNGFDSSFPMYCEDVDLSFRFKLEGFGVFATPFSSFYHDIVSRLYLADDPRKVKSLIGEWCLCFKWGISSRAELIREGILSIDSSIELPVVHPSSMHLTEPIRQLFDYPRYARSLFW